MDEEKRLAFGLLSGFKGNTSPEEWVVRLKAALSKQPTLVGEPDDVAEEKWAAWKEFQGSAEGNALLANARYQIRLNHKREAVGWATWPSDQEHLRGAGSFIEVSSPVNAVEWKWPLTVAIMGDSGYSATHAALTDQAEHGPPWLKVVIRQAQQPAEEVGVADILIFPQGSNAQNTLLQAVAPVTADLLFLCGVGHGQLSDVAAGAEELLQLTQANAILAADIDFHDMTLLVALIEELAHDQQIDVAVAQALRRKRLDPGLMMLFSTPLFVEKSQLSSFLLPLTERLRQMSPGDRLELKEKPNWVGLPNRLAAEEALRILETDIKFGSERLGASTVSAVASAAPPPVSPSVAPKQFTRGATKGAASSADKGTRFLLHELLPQEQTRVKPKEALEAAKHYKLTVHIGQKSELYIAGKESFPEPPVRPEESGVSLAVVFFEENSKPEAELKTIFLPRTGESSTAEFEFTVSSAANVFEGWVSVYHKNRLLQEGVLRSRVIGAVGGAETPPKETEFSIRSMPRPLQIGLEERTLFGGTLRLESGDHATTVRGLRAARVKLPGLKRAMEDLEREFNRMPWEDLGTEWVKDDKAAVRLSAIALQGWQLHEALCDNPLLKDLEKETDKPLLVYAADSNVRAPLELCYAKPQPKTTAKICPEAARAVAEGRCVDGCEGMQNPRDHVCPMGFWSLSRVLEWRSQKADSREDPEALEISNEPAPGRRVLKPLENVVLGRSALVENKDSKQLEIVLQREAPSWKEVKSWEEWEATVGTESPTMLLLMPHVDNQSNPPLMEIQTKKKDPPGIEETDVVGKSPQQPIVLLLGCGAATSLVDFQSLPAQFRRKQAAAVIAPVAQLLAREAPELARGLIETFAEGKHGTRALGEVLLTARRKLVAEGKLAGILLLSFGDADWLL